jgi:hypothetical protein
MFPRVARARASSRASVAIARRPSRVPLAATPRARALASSSSRARVRRRAMARDVGRRREASLSLKSRGA